MEASLASTPASRWGSIHSGAGVLDSLIHRYNKACSLRSCCQGVDAHHGRLPHKGLEVVRDVLVVDVYPIPHAPLKERASTLELLSLLPADLPKNSAVRNFELMALSRGKWHRSPPASNPGHAGHKYPSPPRKLYCARREMSTVPGSDCIPREHISKRLPSTIQSLDSKRAENHLCMPSSQLVKDVCGIKASVVT